MAWSLVQRSAIQAITTSGTLTATISATAPGNLLLLKLVQTGTATPTAVTAGFSLRVSTTQATSPLMFAGIWDDLNNAGGITSVAATVANSAAMVAEEWTCPGVVGATFDVSGTLSNHAPVSPFSIVTSSALTRNNDLAATAYGLRYSSANAATVGAGANFTQNTQRNNGVSAIAHDGFDSDLDTGSSSGSTLTDATTTSSVAAGSQVGVIATYCQPVSLLPQQIRRRTPALFTRISAAPAGAVYPR